MAADLFDYLVLHTSASFISDLRFLQDECAAALSLLDDGAAFSLGNWNHVGDYLCDGYVPQLSCSAAKREILGSLADVTDSD